MILVGDPLNPELNLYLPLDVTGCGVRSKYLQPLVFSLGPNSLKNPRLTCSTQAANFHEKNRGGSLGCG